MTQQESPTTSPDSASFIVLSGLQQGAVARLSERTYLIGSDDECDIVLLDGSVAPKHMALTLQGSQIRIEAQQHAVLVRDQRLEPGQSATISAGTAIQMGAVLMGIGPENMDWTNVILPSQIPSPEADTTKPDSQNAAPLVESTSPESVKTAAEAESESSNANPPLDEPPARTRTLRRWSAVLCVVLAIVGLIYFYSHQWVWLETLTQPSPATPEPSPVDIARAIVANLGLNDIEISALPNGGVVLTGYCDTQARKDQLTSALRAKGVRADNRVWAENILNGQIKETIKRLGGSINGVNKLSHDALGQGAILIKGLLPENLSSDQLQSILRNDVPGVSRIEFKARTLADFIADLRQRVRNAKLEEQVTIAAAGDNLNATGLLDAEQMDRWTRIARTYVEETGNIPKLEQRVKLQAAAQNTDSREKPAPLQISEPPVAPAEPTALKLSVRGVMIGRNNATFALLSNGMRVAEGDWLDKQHFVEKVQFDRIVVRAGSKKNIYFVGENDYE